MIKSLYIAGRIAGEDSYESKFQRASLEVTELGYVPIDPCTLHDSCERSHTSWEMWMVCDLHTMLECDGIYALRDWQTSRGATIEVQLALRLGKEVVYQAR